MKTKLIALAIACGTTLAAASAYVALTGADKHNVIVKVQKFVSQRLKAPSTAKFSPDSENAVVCTAARPLRCGINGWVDSKDSAGAVSRMRYTVSFSDDIPGNPPTMTLVSFKR